MPLSRIFFILLASFSSVSSYANNTHEEPDTEKLYNVYIDKKNQAGINITTQKLVETQLNFEIETFATRIDLAPLFQTQAEYIHALKEQKLAHINFLQTQKIVLRLQNLQRENAISTRKLHDQQTQLKLAQTLFDHTRQQAANIRLLAQSQWGPVLSQWILNADSLAKGQNLRSRSIYLIYQPIATVIPSKTVFIQSFANRDLALPASLIASAPAILAFPQQIGQPYLYSVDPTMAQQPFRVSAWIPVSANNQTGIIIPNSSIVWHLGLAFVYLQIDDQHFKRIMIEHKRNINASSNFIQRGLQADDILVTTGAQMLLSEEFRNQIPAEDDDDDD